DRLDAPLLKPLRESVDCRIGPHVAQCRETGGALLRRFQPEFRRRSTSGRELRRLQQPGEMSTGRAAPGFDEENRVVARRAEAEVSIQPVDQAGTVVDLV